MNTNKPNETPEKSQEEINSELAKMKESEQKFKQRFSGISVPRTELELEYIKKIESSHPIMNPTNIDELLKNMNSLNYGRKKKRKQIIDFETAKKMFYHASMQLTNGEFTFNEYNTPIIEELIKWFIADKSCELDLKRGICFIGFIGTGKTKIFEIFRYMMDAFYKEELKFKIKTCVDVAKDTKGADDLKKYYGGMVMFDDLGMEVNDVKLYGNTVGVMSDIIFQREMSHELNGLITHFTTNLSEKRLEDKYGDRIYDRLQKMCNIVVIKQGFSWRKQR